MTNLTPYFLYSIAKDSQDDDRHCVAVYEPTSWSHDFIESLNSKDDFSICRENVNELEGKVRTLVYDCYDGSSSSSLRLLELIDDIERLGLSYRFQNDIKKILEIMVLKNDNMVEEEEEAENLHVLSLRFRILRQYGFDVTQDFLRRFVNNDGSFMKCLQKDIKGLLSLYEASYLAFEEERNLHDAKLFTMENLKRQENEIFMESITHAVELPLYRRMLRLQARVYIDVYSKRKDSNQDLLELAILDFNMVQSTLQIDLQDVSRWWQKLELTSKLSFIRDRLMECFFWSVGIVSEPTYRCCRLGVTKVCALITTIDDIYDVYGSLDELQQFTDLVKRWDINGVDHLPEYLQVSFLALYNTVNEMAYQTVEQGINIIPILKKVWGELCDAFLVEAIWSYNRFMPTLEAYLENAWISASGVVILNHAYFLMSQDIKKYGHVSVDKYHNLMKWSSMIFRLCNDLATSSDELKSRKEANVILCYMNESGICEVVARERVKTLIDEAWRKMMEARMACSSEFEDPFVNMAINLARTSHYAYQHGDGHGAPNAITKKQILSIIIEPI